MLRSLGAWPLAVVASLAYVCVPARAQDIYYTGKLFGYYRIEPGEKPSLQPVQAFLQKRDSEIDGLLLGMGDNFGPEFGASIQLVGKEPCKIDEDPKTLEKWGEPRALYKDDQRVSKSPECDNVMNFLMQAGYRALAPGREDFIYSSFWLWKMAQEIRGNGDRNPLIKNSDGRLNILAANLRIKWNGSVMKGKCPLLLDSAPSGGNSTQCTPDFTAPEAFDWVDRLDKVVTRPTRRAIFMALLAAGNVKQPLTMTPEWVRQTLVTNQFNILHAAWGTACGIDTSFGKDAAKNLHELPELNDSSEFADFCTENDRNASPEERQKEQDDLRTYWHEFKQRLTENFSTDPTKRSAVTAELGTCEDQQDTSECHKVLLSTTAAQAAQRQLLRVINREMNNTGYTIANAGGQSVLIVGVVGKETMSAVSASNLETCVERAIAEAHPAPESEHAVRTSTGLGPCPNRTPPDAGSVSVFDPVSAVVTAIRAAIAVHGPFSRVIVMAQMPAPEAEILASRVRARIVQINEAQAPAQPVDAVLSEAQTDYQTANVTLEGLDIGEMTPVLTPPTPVFTGPDKKMSGSVAHLSMDHGAQKYENHRALLLSSCRNATRRKITNATRSRQFPRSRNVYRIT